MADRKTGLPVDPTSPLISQIISPLVPMSYQVDEPYSVNTQDIDGGVVYSETPMKVSDPQFAVPPIITGGIEFFKQFMDDPSETAGGIASAVGEELKEYPARQLRTALAGGETFNPETGEIERFDPFAVPATVAAGTAVSVARTLGKDGSGPVLGIMGGRMAKDGPSKFSQARSAKNSGKSRQEVFDEAQAYFDDDILGQDSAAFRFEIPTSNSKLNDKQVFDGRMEGFRSVERDEYDGARSVNDAPFARLEDILDFPELYQQYPEIRDLDVARINEFGGAFYHPIENYIGVADQLDNESFQSALLHEIQHWVQHKEGFPKGGNTENIQNQLAYRMEGADPEMLKGPARDLYESLYGEAEARAVQRRFLDPEEAKLTPVLTRQREASDGDVSMDEMDAVERGEQGLIEALEYGDNEIRQAIEKGAGLQLLTSKMEILAEEYANNLNSKIENIRIMKEPKEEKKIKALNLLVKEKKIELLGLDYLPECEEEEYTEPNNVNKMEAITKWLESNYIDYDGEDLDYDSEVLKKIYYKTIYEEVFENGKKIAQLSRETGISYYSLYNTVRHIKKQIKEQ